MSLKKIFVLLLSVRITLLILVLAAFGIAYTLILAPITSVWLLEVVKTMIFFLLVAMGFTGIYLNEADKY